MNVKLNAEKLFDGLQMGIGTWSWGDRVFWGYGKGYGEEQLKAAFDACIAGGIRFFDTAEVYGTGQSERFLGKFLKTTNEDIKVASKYMPFPWRLRKSLVKKSLINSKSRLGRERIDLYQIHYPYWPLPVEFWAEAMAEVKQEGLIENIGISTCNLDQMHRVQDVLGKAGLSLASNQMEYHLLDRSVERDGLLEECKKTGVKLIAYSPLAMGTLTGKYTPEHPQKGIRGNKYPRSLLAKIQPLIDLMKRIGLEHGEKTPSQVAINWLIAKETFPIPGAKTVNQANQNIAALSWSLTTEEVILLDEMSDKVAG